MAILGLEEKHKQNNENTIDNASNYISTNKWKRQQSKLELDF